MSGILVNAVTFDPPVTVAAGQSIVVLSPGSPRPASATTQEPASTARHSDGFTSDVWVVGKPKRGLVDQPPTLEPCFRCDRLFAQALLGRYGCPNCHGEGLGS